jgi:hypothetical protein
MSRLAELERSRRRSRGQALPEFALVAPVFFLVLLAIIEGGRFIFYYQTLNNATREGARYAIVHGENSFDCSGPPCDAGQDVVDRVRATAFGIPGASIAVTPVWPDGANERGMTVTVRAIYTYTTFVPLLPIPPIVVEAESSLVINN